MAILCRGSHFLLGCYNVHQSSSSSSSSLLLLLLLLFFFFFFSYSSSSSSSSLLLLFFFLDGTTAQCRPSPLQWTSPNPVLWPLFLICDFAFIYICLYTIPPSVLWSSSRSTSLRIIVKHLTYFSFTIHSVKISNPFQPMYLMFFGPCIIAITEE